MAGTGTRLSVLRRAAGTLVVVAFLIGAVAFYRVAPAPPSSSAAEPASTTSAAEPATSPAMPASASPTPTSAAPSVTPSTSPAPTPDRRPPRTRSGLPAGPGTTSPGILLIARLDSDGTFDVSEMVRLADPLSVVTLTPPRVSRAGERFVTANPVASSVELSAGDQDPRVPKGKITRPTAVPFAAPATRFKARYTLSGVTVRNLPAPRGRALAALQPLVGGVPTDLPVQVIVTGRPVLNLVCPDLPLPEQACAAGTVPRMRVNRVLPLRTALVVVQLNVRRHR